MPKNSDSYFKYDNSIEEYDSILADPRLTDHSLTWSKTNTLDFWRHDRMRRTILPFVIDDMNSSWLTVGDGRYGSDGNFLLKCGIKIVHCSDISDSLLKIGHETGFINEYSSQNAENINFEDNSFDYVFCKESIHHFPRPYLALYEMFRVARKAVILIEPRDQMCDRSHFRFIYHALRFLLGRPNIDQHYFEPVGNYVYSVSERELNKFMLGMHYTKIGFIGLNDAYIPGVEYVDIKSYSPRDLYLKLKIYSRIFVLDIFCKLGLLKSNILTATLFKTPPTQSLENGMKSSGWKIFNLPKNPYI